MSASDLDFVEAPWEGAWGGRGCCGSGGDGGRWEFWRSLLFGGLLGRRREGCSGCGVQFAAGLAGLDGVEEGVVAMLATYIPGLAYAHVSRRRFCRDYIVSI
jgi:hypothetical protein